ncbi:hypothetical protein AHMF7605_17715 [Adhaeribacter arboris]|uniref:DUF4783 domain-containing protein n=1 Tax=Adhaeribacter arboris TaxID=2072846 RepID=A0A2T2YI72_9BACT|nr:DUF4783 domain-containing protein [Adhaeribacter arboris]PSR55213.1 hypothetical protein AHMF7605_17715 [Adhaeribacter arboris]
MKTIKLVLTIMTFVVTSWVFTGQVYAQDDVLSGVRAALGNGDSKELAQYFNTSVEIGIDGNKSTYSQTQAEFVLRDFFSKQAPTGLERLHNGSSDQGLTYEIMKYKYNGGSYRVMVYIKQFRGANLIDTIEFTKE